MARHPHFEQRRSRPRRAIGRQLRDGRRAGMYILVGAALGMGAFVAIDSLGSPKESAALGAFSLRAPYYASCREAFQDGRANIRRGEPGYRPSLDADNDGLACEPYRSTR